MRTVYRIRVNGMENLPAGGCLLAPNHVTWVDAIVAVVRKLLMLLNHLLANPHFSLAS